MLPTLSLNAAPSSTKQPPPWSTCTHSSNALPSPTHQDPSVPSNQSSTLPVANWTTPCPTSTKWQVNECQFSFLYLPTPLTENQEPHRRFNFANVDSILSANYIPQKDSTLLVDIGGGRGYDLEEIRTCFPDAESRLVLQDLPPVIDDVCELRGDIERMKYDFFTPQPIFGPSTSPPSISSMFPKATPRT